MTPPGKSTRTTIADTLALLSSNRETAEIGISRSELYRRIESGVLRTRLVGRVMRLARDYLLAMINELP